MLRTFSTFAKQRFPWKSNSANSYVTILATCLPGEEISFEGVPVESHGLSLRRGVMPFTDDALKLCVPPRQRLRVRISSWGLGARLQGSRAGDREGSAPGIFFSLVTGFTGRENQLQLRFYLVWVFVCGFFLSPALQNKN